MILQELLRFKRIAIQCHDNPDADALASGHALHAYLTAQGKETRLFYGGRSPIGKPNLVEMTRALDIPAVYAPEPVPPGEEELLVTVDCQYGAGNVAPVRAAHVAVIDHHIQETEFPGVSDVRPFLGSCSTLVWDLLRERRFNLVPSLSTALYYGLYTDTGGFAEIRHPLDRDMRDSLEPDWRTLKKLIRCNLSLEDLSLAASSLNALEYEENGRFVLVEAPPCDPNILGFISDLTMQVDKVDMAVVYFQDKGDIKYSVRTAAREVKAAELATWLAAGGIGSGGGHVEKAGGHIIGTKYRDAHGNTKLMAYFGERLRRYLAAYDIIDCALPGEEHTRGMDVYRKLPVPVGHVPCAKLFPDRTTLHVRMLEGDVDIHVDGDTYLMIGIAGEVYPIRKDKFAAAYSATRRKFAPDLEYPPVVLNRDTGVRVPLLHVAKACIGKGGFVRAKRLERGVKVFTRWDQDAYLRGEPGDWLVSRPEDPADIYVVTATIFPFLYAPVG
jgi:phosphoglycolate phosphatase